MFQAQRGFTPPPPQMNAVPPGMHPPQRQPSGPPGSGFQNMPNARVGNPNTPSSKRPQDVRSQLPGQPKTYAKL